MAARGKKNRKTFGPGLSDTKRKKLLKLFALDMMATTAAELAGVSRNTANLHYRQWRELIYTSLRRAPRFNGIVEMDQSEFGGRGKKSVESQVRHARKNMSYHSYMAFAAKLRRQNKIKVFGILQRGGNVFVQTIKRADRNTLMPIIRHVVEEGSTIITDRWAAFSELQIDGYAHESVNHSVEYVDARGNHTNSIESFWSFAKRRLSKFNGMSRTTLPLHIKECEFRFNHDDVARAIRSLEKKHSP